MTKSNSLIIESESHSVVSDSLRPHRLYSPWTSPGQNTEVGSLSFLQGIFPTQGSNPGLPHRRQILYQLSHKGSPTIRHGWPIPSPVDFPNPGIKLGSPALQVDFLPTELPGNPGLQNRKRYKKESPGLPLRLSGKEFACQCRRYGFHPTCHRATKPSITTTEPVLWSPEATTTEACVP